MLRLDSRNETAKLATALLNLLPEGSLLLLSGPLGAGKTTLTQALGHVLGFEGHISSPTYTLIHEYPTPKGLLVHIDAYRLPEAKALIDLGLDDYLERARLVVVEWGEPLADMYSESFLLHLTVDDAAGERRTVRLAQADKELSHTLFEIMQK